MLTNQTPTDIEILPREPDLDISDCLVRDWHGNDPFKTAYFNAFSIVFPVGEHFFIESVRAFDDRIEDPTLKRQVRGFIGQEGRHRREHQDYNTTLCQARGYDLEYLESRQRDRISMLKKRASTYQWLAATVALEHLTAIMADGLLRNPAWLDGAEPEMTMLWRWHAIEETEHKAVTFDVYRAVGGWDSTRRQMLKIVTWNLLRDTLAYTRYMLRVAGRHRDMGLWWRGLSWLFGRHGIWRPHIGEWRDFNRADFHPWDNDNRTLLDQWIPALQTAS
ncbi:MAG: metal-dependent hydrolase [Pseudomonadota bacterium]